MQVRRSFDRYVLDSFRRRSFIESDYLWLVVRTIATLGEQGMAVILGRGAPFVLGPDRALRVLVVSCRARRAERLARRHGLPPAEALRRLAREDEKRREFLSQFKVDPDDPALYDLVVNTETLGVDGCVTLVVDALRVHGSRSGATRA